MFVPCSSSVFLASVKQQTDNTVVSYDFGPRGKLIALVTCS